MDEKTSHTKARLDETDCPPISPKLGEEKIPSGLHFFVVAVVFLRVF